MGHGPYRTAPTPIGEPANTRRSGMAFEFAKIMLAGHIRNGKTIFEQNLAHDAFEMAEAMLTEEAEWK